MVYFIFQCQKRNKQFRMISFHYKNHVSQEPLFLYQDTVSLKKGSVGLRSINHINEVISTSLPFSPNLNPEVYSLGVHRYYFCTYNFCTNKSSVNAIHLLPFSPFNIQMHFSQRTLESSSFPMLLSIWSRAIFMPRGFCISLSLVSHISEHRKDRVETFRRGTA